MHSPCRDLAVVHVRCNDHACFPFVALLEREARGGGVGGGGGVAEKTGSHDVPISYSAAAAGDFSFFFFSCRNSFSDGGTVQTERRSMAGMEKDLHSQFEIKLKSSLLCFFFPPPLPLTPGGSALPDTFQRHSSRKFQNVTSPDGGREAASPHGDKLEAV